MSDYLRSYNIDRIDPGADHGLVQELTDLADLAAALAHATVVAASSPQSQTINLTDLHSTHRTQDAGRRNKLVNGLNGNEGGQGETLLIQETIALGLVAQTLANNLRPSSVDYQLTAPAIIEASKSENRQGVSVTRQARENLTLGFPQHSQKQTDTTPPQGATELLAHIKARSDWAHNNFMDKEQSGTSVPRPLTAAANFVYSVTQFTGNPVIALEALAGTEKSLGWLHQTESHNKHTRKHATPTGAELTLSGAAEAAGTLFYALNLLPVKIVDSSDLDKKGADSVVLNSNGPSPHVLQIKSRYNLESTNTVVVHDQGMRTNNPTPPQIVKDFMTFINKVNPENVLLQEIVGVNHDASESTTVLLEVPRSFQGLIDLFRKK